MSTRQSAIILKMIERLREGLPEATPPIEPLGNMKEPHRAITRPIHEDILPVFAVAVVENFEDDNDYERDIQPADGAFRRCSWVWVEARVLADREVFLISQGPDEILDPYVEFATSVLLSDMQLGGLCDNMKLERVIYEAFEGEEIYCSAGMLFKLYYIGDPI